VLVEVKPEDGSHEGISIGDVLSALGCLLIEGRDDELEVEQ